MSSIKWQSMLQTNFSIFHFSLSLSLCVCVCVFVCVCVCVCVTMIKNYLLIQLVHFSKGSKKGTKLFEKSAHLPFLYSQSHFFVNIKD